MEETIVEEITIDALEQKATRCHREGLKWHIHMLSPDCRFNDRPGKHAFVLEDGENLRTYIVYSDVPHTEVDRRLLLMLHGDEILDRIRGATDSEDERMQRILDEARRRNENSLPWHHHILFPDCVFNEYKGKYTIVFESEDEDCALEVVYDEEPVEDLRRIEILFFERTL